MSQEHLPTIPTPPGQRWRQFRQKGLPGLAFFIVLALSVWLWGANLASPLVMGQAEGNQASVLCPEDGDITSWTAQMYQEVEAGQIIGVIATSSPDVLSNKLALLTAELSTARISDGLDPADQMRLAELKLDWLQLREELAIARINLAYAETNLQRVFVLHTNDITSLSLLDFYQELVAVYRESISGKLARIQGAESTIKNFDPSISGQAGELIQEQLKTAELRYRVEEVELRPKIIRAPIRGKIVKLDAMVGNFVSRGQAVATIANQNIDRIVGYIPQPVRVEPRVGMPVEIRSRGSDRVTVRSTVADVGPRIELFDAPLRIRGMGAAQERGLPIIVSVPDNLKLRPGELVELRLITD